MTALPERNEESEGCSKEMVPVVSSNLLDPLYRLDTGENRTMALMLKASTSVVEFDYKFFGMTNKILV
ncbi:hypothetical protein NQ317_011756 [Molorchus minor]|uniref:Uncharacterized protein n=1 Tax=Molorchus minor TaxID=1323400 RepID=A0ABQ9JT86_9CUCU|nr:hypothetical protein NQ317_011756 [Molorchus minor]